jgi:malate synthase
VTATCATTRRRPRSPIAREIVATYVTNVVRPWYIDLLNLNLDNHDLAIASARIQAYIEFDQDGTRITENLEV